MARIATNKGRFEVDVNPIEERRSRALKQAGAEIQAHFHAGNDVDATEFGMVQTMHSEQNGTVDHVGAQATDVANREQNGAYQMNRGMLATADQARGNMIPAGEPGQGTYIDQAAGGDNPMYRNTPGAVEEETDQLAAPLREGASNDNATHGEHYRENGQLHNRAAYLHDAPNYRYAEDSPDSIQDGSEMVLETTCLAIAGTDEGQYYGSFRWGWRANAGRVQLIQPELVSRGNPSANFQRAAQQWNSQDGNAQLPIPEGDGAQTERSGNNNTPTFNEGASQRSNQGGTESQRAPTQTSADAVQAELVAERERITETSTPELFQKLNDTELRPQLKAFIRETLQSRHLEVTVVIRTAEEIGNDELYLAVGPTGQHTPTQSGGQGESLVFEVPMSQLVRNLQRAPASIAFRVYEEDGGVLGDSDDRVGRIQLPSGERGLHGNMDQGQRCGGYEVRALWRPR